MTDDAILVAHGQPSDPGPQQIAIEALAARVAAIGSGRRVYGATLAAPDALRLAVAKAPDALIYPMFMAAGWFTGTELPRRLAQAGGTGVRLLQPFGLDPDLPDLCARAICGAASSRGWAADEVTVLLIAHGSQRARGSAKGAQAMAQALAPQFRRILPAFIEEQPLVADVAQQEGRKAIALPFFATQAEHVTDDIPKALSVARFDGPCLPPIGLSDAVPGLIAAALRRADKIAAKARVP